MESSLLTLYENEGSVWFDYRYREHFAYGCVGSDYVTVSTSSVETGGDGSDSVWLKILSQVECIVTKETLHTQLVLDPMCTGLELVMNLRSVTICNGRAGSSGQPIPVLNRLLVTTSISLSLNGPFRLSHGKDSVYRGIPVMVLTSPAVHAVGGILVEGDAVVITKELCSNDGERGQLTFIERLKNDDFDMCINGNLSFEYHQLSSPNPFFHKHTAGEGNCEEKHDQPRQVPFVTDKGELPLRSPTAVMSAVPSRTTIAVSSWLRCRGTLTVLANCLTVSGFLQATHCCFDKVGPSSSALAAAHVPVLEGTHGSHLYHNRADTLEPKLPALTTTSSSWSYDTSSPSSSMQSVRESANTSGNSHSEPSSEKVPRGPWGQHWRIIISVGGVVECETLSGSVTNNGLFVVHGSSLMSSPTLVPPKGTLFSDRALNNAEACESILADVENRGTFYVIGARLHIHILRNSGFLALLLQPSEWQASYSFSSPSFPPPLLPPSTHTSQSVFPSSTSSSSSAFASPSISSSSSFFSSPPSGGIRLSTLIRDIRWDQVTCYTHSTPSPLSPPPSSSSSLPNQPSSTPHSGTQPSIGSWLPAPRTSMILIDQMTYSSTSSVCSAHPLYLSAPISTFASDVSPSPLNELESSRSVHTRQNHTQARANPIRGSETCSLLPLLSLNGTTFDLFPPPPFELPSVCIPSSQSPSSCYRQLADAVPLSSFITTLHSRFESRWPNPFTFPVTLASPVVSSINPITRAPYDSYHSEPSPSMGRRVHTHDSSDHRHRVRVVQSLLQPQGNPQCYPSPPNPTLSLLISLIKLCKPLPQDPLYVIPPTDSSGKTLCKQALALLANAWDIATRAPASRWSLCETYSLGPSSRPLIGGDRLLMVDLLHDLLASSEGSMRLKEWIGRSLLDYRLASRTLTGEGTILTKEEDLSSFAFARDLDQTWLRVCSVVHMITATLTIRCLGSLCRDTLISIRSQQDIHSDSEHVYKNPTVLDLFTSIRRIAQDTGARVYVESVYRLRTTYQISQAVPLVDDGTTNLPVYEHHRLRHLNISGLAMFAGFMSSMIHVLRGEIIVPPDCLHQDTNVPQPDGQMEMKGNVNVITNPQVGAPKYVPHTMYIAHRERASETDPTPPAPCPGAWSNLADPFFQAITSALAQGYMNALRSNTEEHNHLIIRAFHETRGVNPRIVPSDSHSADTTCNAPETMQVQNVPFSRSSQIAPRENHRSMTHTESISNLHQSRHRGHVGQTSQRRTHPLLSEQSNRQFYAAHSASPAEGLMNSPLPHLLAALAELLKPTSSTTEKSLLPTTFVQEYSHFFLPDRLAVSPVYLLTPSFEHFPIFNNGDTRSTPKPSISNQAKPLHFPSPLLIYSATSLDLQGILSVPALYLIGKSVSIGAAAIRHASTHLSSNTSLVNYLALWDRARGETGDGPFLRPLNPLPKQHQSLLLVTGVNLLEGAVDPKKYLTDTKKLPSLTDLGQSTRRRLVRSVLDSTISISSVSDILLSDLVLDSHGSVTLSSARSIFIYVTPRPPPQCPALISASDLRSAFAFTPLAGLTSSGYLTIRTSGILGIDQTKVVADLDIHMTASGYLEPSPAVLTNVGTSGRVKHTSLLLPAPISFVCTSIDTGGQLVLTSKGISFTSGLDILSSLLIRQFSTARAFAGIAFNTDYIRLVGTFTATTEYRICGKLWTGVSDADADVLVTSTAGSRQTYMPVPPYVSFDYEKESIPKSKRLDPVNLPKDATFKRHIELGALTVEESRNAQIETDREQTEEVKERSIALLAKFAITTHLELNRVWQRLIRPSLPIDLTAPNLVQGWATGGLKNVGSVQRHPPYQRNPTSSTRTALIDSTSMPSSDSKPAKG